MSPSVPEVEAARPLTSDKTYPRISAPPGATTRSSTYSFPVVGVTTNSLMTTMSSPSGAGVPVGVGDGDGLGVGVGVGVGVGLGAEHPLKLDPSTLVPGEKRPTAPAAVRCCTKGSAPVMSGLRVSD